MLWGLPPLSSRIGVRVHRLAWWIERRRRAILVGSLLLLLGAGLLAASLPIRSDIAQLLPPSTPSVVALRQLEQRIASFGTILVVVESPDPARRARAAERLAARLGTLDPKLVTSVVSGDREARDFVWRNRFLFAELSDLRAARDALDDEIRRAKLASNPLYVDLEDEDEGPDAAVSRSDATAELRRKLHEARAARDATGGMVSRDGRMQLLVVQTTFDNSALSLADRLVADLDAMVASVQREMGPSVTISSQGDVYSALAEHRALRRGVFLATLLTVVVVAAGLLLYFRSVLSLAALLFSLALGTVVTFGITRLTIGHLNLATAFLSSIVVGNGINTGLVLLARFDEERRAGKRGPEAIGAAMAGTFAGTLTAALTASVAYASLTITSFDGFRDFGIIGGVGMVACFASAYLVLPACLATLERMGALRQRKRREPALGRLAARLVPRRPMRVTCVGFVLTGLAGAAAWHFVAGDPLEKSMKGMLSDSDELVQMRARMQRIHTAFSWDTSRAFVIAAPDRATARRAAAAMRDADGGMPPDRRLFSSIQTLEDALPRQQGAKLALLADIRRAIDDALPDVDGEQQRSLLELRPPDDLRSLGDQDVPRSIAARFTEKDGTRGRLILAHARKDMDADHIPSIIGFAEAVRALDLGSGVIFGGSMFVFADVLRHMEWDGPRATIAALLGATLVVLLLVGPNRHGLVTLFCCIAGTALMLACAWLLGLKGNVLDFIALPITIGIGIDYSVNIAMRERRDGPGSIDNALRTVGGAVIMCSFTTVVGYGSLLLSANRGIRSFGTAAIIGEVTCLLAALALAPALLSLRRGEHSPR